MSELKRLLVEHNGETTELLIEVPEDSPIPESPASGGRPGEKGVSDVILTAEEVHEKIKAYANFVIGSFKNFETAEIEEINIKFGVKIGGKAGVIFTEGSAEGSLEISVKCKFPA